MTEMSLLFQDPSGGIPKGTLLAIFWTTLSYLLISVTVGEIRHKRSTDTHCLMIYADVRVGMI